MTQKQNIKWVVSAEDICPERQDRLVIYTTITSLKDTVKMLIYNTFNNKQQIA